MLENSDILKNQGSQCACLSCWKQVREICFVSFESRSSTSDTFIGFIRTADGKCQARIDIDGPATIASWYEVWEVVTVIASMCTRAKNKGGKAKNLGTCYAHKAPTGPGSSKLADECSTRSPREH